MRQIAIIGVILVSCGTADRQEATFTPSYVFSYQLRSPDAVFVLPELLREISGITVAADGNLQAVQDENGVIFTIDSWSGRVVREAIFHKKGDYEGIAYTPTHCWVLRSDGDLYKVPHTHAVVGQIAKHRLWKGETWEAEGLCVSPSGRQLIIALKHFRQYEKAILVANADTFAWEEWIVWRNKDWKKQFEQAGVKINDDFAPSGVAVHPRTGDYYIISSAANALVVASEQGILSYVAKLDQLQLPQPEGIAFAPDGTLFIASEGTQHGFIARFHPK